MSRASLDPGQAPDTLTHVHPEDRSLQGCKPRLTHVADVTAMPRLLSVVATGACSLLNFADLSRSLALPQTTLKRYFALLEATFLVQLLRPWSSNLGQRIIQTPKVYLNYPACWRICWD